MDLMARNSSLRMKNLIIVIIVVIVIIIIGGVVALSVECQTCDQEVVGSSLGRARGVKTLGKFVTPMCLCSPSSI